MDNVLFVCLFFFVLQRMQANDPVLEKRCIKIDARDISIYFRRNTTIKFKDVPANAPATNPALRFYNTQYHNTTQLHPLPACVVWAQSGTRADRDV